MSGEYFEATVNGIRYYGDVAKTLCDLTATLASARAEADAAKAKLAAVEALCEKVERNGATANAEARAKTDIRARHYAMGVVDGHKDAFALVRAALSVEPEEQQ
jgi:hypothetical protein